MSKHTPGPWHESFGKVRDDNNQLVANVYDTNGEDEQIIANTRLIAAAPELLKALKDIAGREGDFYYAREVRRLAKTAIAKVEGK